MIPDTFGDQSLDSRSDLISPKLLSPLLIGLPHDLGLGQVKLSGPEEPEQGGVVVSIVAY